MVDTLSSVDTSTPLGGYAVTRSTSITSVRDAVNSFTWDEHQLLSNDGRDLQAVVNGVRVGSFGLLFVRYGANVRVVAPPTGKRVVVAVPLGPMAVEGPTGRSCTTTEPFALSMTGPTTMVPDALRGCIVGAVDATELEDSLLTSTGAAQPLRFVEPGEPSPHQTDVIGSTWRGVCQHVDTLGRTNLGAAAQRLLSQMLTSSILVGLPHSSRSYVDAAATNTVPSYVTRALEFLETNLATPMTVPQVARAVGVSVRQLNTAFQNYHGTTPTMHLRALRLARSHQLLLSAGPDDTVSSIAMACGFTHFGRFSTYYAERYGCSPSETLRSSTNPSGARAHLLSPQVVPIQRAG